MSTPLLLLAALAGGALGLLVGLRAGRRHRLIVLVASAIGAPVLLALSAAGFGGAALAGFACLGLACGVLGPLWFGRTPVGAAAAIAALAFASWCSLWAMFAAGCALSAECA